MILVVCSNGDQSASIHFLQEEVDKIKETVTRWNFLLEITLTKLIGSYCKPHIWSVDSRKYFIQVIRASLTYKTANGWTSFKLCIISMHSLKSSRGEIVPCSQISRTKINVFLWVSKAAKYSLKFSLTLLESREPHKRFHFLIDR